MARQTLPLNNTQIQQAKPKEKEYNLSDGAGLSLRVKTNGSKLWLFNYYRPFTKQRVNMSFGAYPAVSLADARRKRDGARQLLADQIDPQEQRDTEAAAITQALETTLEVVAEKWFALKQTNVTQAYAEDIWRSLNNHIFPKLGSTPIHKIKAPATISVLKPIAAKGSLETVKRLIQRLNEVMVFALNTGVIDANPIAGISKAFQAPVKQNMPALRPDELPELMQALSIASIKLSTRCLIEWQLHTMTRPSEAAGTKWSEIDFEHSLWVIPSSRMKKGREHRIPLTEQALGLLDRMKSISGGREHVFPGDRNPRAHINEQTANMALKRMGFEGRLVAHGLRSIASTTLNEQGFDPDVVEAALAHVDANEVRRAYNRSEYLERRKKMMIWWSNWIDQACEGSVSVKLSRQFLKAV